MSKIMNDLPTWREVLDCYQNVGRWGHISAFMEVVLKTGYKYFNWNGIIYEITNNGMNYVNTGLKAEDIKL
jgi:hypothetical protein